MQHKGLPVLPFSRYHSTVSNPIKIKHIDDPTSFGGVLRAHRRTQKLTIKALANIMHVTEGCILKWELNKKFPKNMYLTQIRGFLGYDPFQSDREALLTAINTYKEAHELTQLQVARMLGMRSSRITLWKSGQGIPSKETIERVYARLDALAQANA